MQQLHGMLAIAKLLVVISVVIAKFATQFVFKSPKNLTVYVRRGL